MTAQRCSDVFRNSRQPCASFSKINVFMRGSNGLKEIDTYYDAFADGHYFVSTDGRRDRNKAAHKKTHTTNTLKRTVHLSIQQPVRTNRMGYVGEKQAGSDSVQRCNTPFSVPTNNPRYE